MRAAVIFLGFLGMALQAGADSLLLKQGDLLHGKLVQIQDDTLVFRTELAGQLIVPVDEVTTLTTDRSLIFELRDGQTLPATLIEADGQHFLVASKRDTRIPLALADIRKTAALPYDTKPKGPDAPSLLNPEWQTSGELGLSGHVGTRDYLAPFAKIALRKEGEQFDFSSYLRLEMEETAELPDHVRAALEWDLHRGRAWYPQVYASAERNLAEGRALRADLGVGIGGVLYDGPAGLLTGGAGIGVGIERTDTDDLVDRGDLDWMRNREDSDEDLNLRLQLRYTRDLYAGALWEKRLELYPSLTDLGELRARYETALWVPLTPRLKLKVDASVGYDSDRELRGLQEWESTVGASVSVEF